MLPTSCSVSEKGKPCVNPPEFIVSVVVESDEYMIGVTCDKHKTLVNAKVEHLQKDGKVPAGKINFTALKSVGTDCIKGDPNDLIQLDSL